MEDITNNRRPSQLGTGIDDVKPIALPDVAGLRDVSAGTTTLDEAPDLANLSISDTEQPGRKPPIITTHPLIHEYLLEHSPEYERVHLFRRKVVH
jgi:hypothetical protein